jgi:hypothetical protein
VRRDQDAVEKAMKVALLADTDLVAALGGNYVGPWERGRERRVPSVRYRLVADPVTERVARITYQVDCWAEGRAALNTIVDRVQRVLHGERRRTVGGIEMATLCVDGRELDDPQPGVLRYSMDFRFEPVRER